MAPPTMGWSLPCQSLIKKIAFRLSCSWTLWRHFLNWDSLLSNYSSLCQRDIKVASMTFQFNKDEVRETTWYACGLQRPTPSCLENQDSFLEHCFWGRKEKKLLVTVSENFHGGNDSPSKEQGACTRVLSLPVGLFNCGDSIYWRLGAVPITLSSSLCVCLCLGIHAHGGQKTTCSHGFSSCTM